MSRLDQSLSVAAFKKALTGESDLTIDPNTFTVSKSGQLHPKDGRVRIPEDEFIGLLHIVENPEPPTIEAREAWAKYCSMRKQGKEEDLAEQEQIERLEFQHELEFLERAALTQKIEDKYYDQSKS